MNIEISEEMKRTESFKRNLDGMEESKFKRDYMANISGNQVMFLILF